MKNVFLIAIAVVCLSFAAVACSDKQKAELTKACASFNDAAEAVATSLPLFDQLCGVDPRLEDQEVCRKYPEIVAKFVDATAKIKAVCSVLTPTTTTVTTVQ